MTEETAQLFDAPYKVYETRNGYNVICTNKVLPQLCWTTDKKDANRISHLPELYDALAETIEEHCDLCINYTGDKPKLLIEEILKFGCLAKSKTCHCVKKIELLRKVRDGK